MAMIGNHSQHFIVFYSNKQFSFRRGIFTCRILQFTVYVLKR